MAEAGFRQAAAGPGPRRCDRGAQAAAAEGPEEDRLRQLPPRLAGARRRLAGQRGRLDAARSGGDGHVPAHRARGIHRGVRSAEEELSMGIEIERKFLPRSDGWRTAAHKVVPMAQGYLNDLALVDSGAMRASV